MADAMVDDDVFPEDIMLCILTRLPVKSLLRFKSVCKSWRELFATPYFRKLHHQQFSSDPKNEAFIIKSYIGFNKQAMSLFSIESKEEKLANLDLPCHGNFPRIYHAWCCNGLVCIGFIPLDMGIIALWNPALRLSKFVPLSEGDLGIVRIKSLGFGYDPEGDDFKVVRIGSLNGKEREIRVDIYSAKSDSWKTIMVGFQFWLGGFTSGIVNGNPYWIVTPIVDEIIGDVSLMWCDLTKLEFKTVPLLDHMVDRLSDVKCVDWKGSLAVILDRKWPECVDVLVFDDDEMIWKKNYTFGPMEIGVNRCLHCSKNGIIMGECSNGKLFVFDPQSGWVKEIKETGQRGYFKIYGYNESLVYIKGMEQV